jgi:hypothetical protein
MNFRKAQPMQRGLSQPAASLVIPSAESRQIGRLFLDIARLQEPNPLLYRCFPLTCARSQE